MSQVNTVLGPIDSADLGFTLSHEHITLGAAGTAAAYPGFQDRQAIADAASAALAEAYAGGVRTIIDVTTLDLGRDVAMMQEVSHRSGVHAIPCTGNHLAVPRIFWGAPVDRVAALFIKEIEEGIEDTGVKAGIIKVASDRGGVTENEEIVLRAAARASNATGTRISTHTWSPDRVGEQQVRILKEEGVDLNRVYMATATTIPTLATSPACWMKASGSASTATPAGALPKRPAGRSARRSSSSSSTPAGPTA